MRYVERWFLDDLGMEYGVTVDEKDVPEEVDLEEASRAFTDNMANPFMIHP